MAKKRATKKKAGGPGKKECPVCGAYVGVRTQECDCGHQFEIKAKKAAVKKATPSGNANLIHAVVTAQKLITLAGGPEKAKEILKEVIESQ